MSAPRFGRDSSITAREWTTIDGQVCGAPVQERTLCGACVREEPDASVAAASHLCLNSFSVPGQEQSLETRACVESPVRRRRKSRVEARVWWNAIDEPAQRTVLPGVLDLRR